MITALENPPSVAQRAGELIAPRVGDFDARSKTLLIAHSHVADMIRAKLRRFVTPPKGKVCELRR